MTNKEIYRDDRSTDFRGSSFNAPVNIIMPILKSGHLDQALEASLEYTSPDSPLYDEILSIKKSRIENKKARLELPNTDPRVLEVDGELETLKNKLGQLIEKLEGQDFRDKEQKLGSVCYRIPPMMLVNEQNECNVWIAFEKDTLLKEIEIQLDDQEKEMRVSDAMGTELLDDKNGLGFKIKTYDETIQPIEKDLVTKWKFRVTPIKKGKHLLILRIIAVIEQNGKERKKSIVLEENIEIVTSITDELKKAKLFAGKEIMNGFFVLPPKSPHSSIEEPGSEQNGPDQNTPSNNPQPSGPELVTNGGGTFIGKLSTLLPTLKMAIVGVASAGLVYYVMSDSPRPPIAPDTEISISDTGDGSSGNGIVAGSNGPGTIDGSGSSGTGSGSGGPGTGGGSGGSGTGEGTGGGGSGAGSNGPGTGGGSGGSGTGGGSGGSGSGAGSNGSGTAGGSGGSGIGGGLSGSGTAGGSGGSGTGEGTGGGGSGAGSNGSGTGGGSGGSSIGGGLSGSGTGGGSGGSGTGEGTGPLVVSVPYININDEKSSCKEDSIFIAGSIQKMKPNGVLSHIENGEKIPVKTDGSFEFTTTFNGKRHKAIQLNYKYGEDKFVKKSWQVGYNLISGN